MGNFNYQCGKCGWGPNGHGEDGRDYFGKPAQVVATTRSGKEVRMNGDYTGYGAVELPGGQEFYLKQFEEYWEGWSEHRATDPVVGPFVGGGILCDDCCWDSPPTSMTEYALSDFLPVKEYLERAKTPVAPPAPPAVTTVKPAKVKAAPKPKPLTKEQLVAKVAELEAVVARLKPMEQRLKDLDQAYARLNASNQAASKKLDKIKNALYGYDE